MEDSGRQEQKAGRIAAALSEVQEAQGRIEEGQKKSDGAQAGFAERLASVEAMLGQGLTDVGYRIESVRQAAVHLGMSFEKKMMEKKPVRLAHHLRAGGTVAGALAVGILSGWMWALHWLRSDETSRIAMDSEREIGSIVLAKYSHADKEQRDLITLLLSSDAMSEKQRRRLISRLEAQTGRSTVGKH